MANTALEALRELDQAKYLACLFVPEQKREAFAALGAYAAELKRIPLLVSEPLPGEIRLQWWRDVISGTSAGQAASHPVAAALLKAIATHNLPLNPLDAMAEARIFDLYHDPMPDIAALETYLGETEAALIQLGGLILDPANAGKSAKAAGHAGMAIGIANMLRQLPRATNRQRMFIPETILNAIGCTAEQIFAGDDAARSRSVTALVALGRDHLKSFKRLAKSVKPQLRPAFLAAALCEPIFRKVERAGAKAFATEVTLPPLLTPIRLAYRAMRGW
jgi:15-cis-phytoene synthase